MSKKILIWIGDRIPHYPNLNDLNLAEYLYRGSLCIQDIERSSDERGCKWLCDQYGGTLLELKPSGLCFETFKPFGSDNRDSWDGSYLRTAVRYTSAEVQRVGYKNPAERKVLCSRVMTRTGTWMMSYGLDASHETRMFYPEIVKLIAPLRTEGLTYPSCPNEYELMSHVSEQTQTNRTTEVTAVSISAEQQQQRSQGVEVGAIVMGAGVLAAEAAIGAFLFGN